MKRCVNCKFSHATDLGDWTVGPPVCLRREVVEWGADPVYGVSVECFHARTSVGSPCGRSGNLYEQYVPPPSLWARLRAALLPQPQPTEPK